MSATDIAAPAERDTWLILGASSGLAREFARLAAQAGCDLILAGRDIDDLHIAAADLRLRGAASAQVLRFDARAIDEHAALAEAVALSLHGPLCLLVAFASFPAHEQMERFPGLAAQTIEAGLTGAVSVLLALTPLIEQREPALRARSRIVIVGSVAGDRGRRRNYIYGAAKAGLAAFASGLRARLAVSNVPVTLIKPGPLDTAMAYGRAGGRKLPSAAGCALACWRAAQRGRSVLYYPRRWGPIMAVVRALPEAIFKRLDF